MKETTMRPRQPTKNQDSDTEVEAGSKDRAIASAESATQVTQATLASQEFSETSLSDTAHPASSDLDTHAPSEEHAIEATTTRSSDLPSNVDLTRDKIRASTPATGATSEVTLEPTVQRGIRVSELEHAESVDGDTLTLAEVSVKAADPYSDIEGGTLANVVRRAQRMGVSLSELEKKLPTQLRALTLAASQDEKKEEDETHPGESVVDEGTREGFINMEADSVNGYESENDEFFDAETGEDQAKHDT